MEALLIIYPNLQSTLFVLALSGELSLNFYIIKNVSSPISLNVNHILRDIS